MSGSEIVSYCGVDETSGVLLSRSELVFKSEAKIDAATCSQLVMS